MSPEELKLAIDTVWVIVAGCMVLSHAGRLRDARGRVLAWQERRRSRRQDPRQPLDRDASRSGRSASRWRSATATRCWAPTDSSTCRRPQLHCSARCRVSDVPLSAKFLFQVVFCAVSLAIVWGTMLDRTKFGVYIIFAIVFAAPDLPARGPLDLGRRIPRTARHAGLRRLDSRPPLRRDRSARGHAHARERASASSTRRQAAADPGPLHAAGRLGRAHPLVRLVRLQPRLDARRRRRPLRGHRRDHQPGRARRRARRR